MLIAGAAAGFCSSHAAQPLARNRARCADAFHRRRYLSKPSQARRAVRTRCVAQRAGAPVSRAPRSSSTLWNRFSGRTARALTVAAATLSGTRNLHLTGRVAQRVCDLIGPQPAGFGADQEVAKGQPQTMGRLSADPVAWCRHRRIAQSVHSQRNCGCMDVMPPMTSRAAIKIKAQARRSRFA